MDTTNQYKQVIGIPAIVIGSLTFLSVLAFFFICCTDSDPVPNGFHQTGVSGATMNDINRMPQLTAQTLNPPPYFATPAGTTYYAGDTYNVKPSQRSYY